MKRFQNVFKRLVGIPIAVTILCLGVSPAWTQTLGYVTIAPNATYLHVDAVDASGTADASAIDLGALGIAAGDFIKLDQVGGFKRGDSFVDGYRFMVGVFSGTSALGPKSDLNRVTGAIDAGVDAVTVPTFALQEPTDIREDFRINPTVIVQVPVGASYLFIAALDVYYSDNTDPNGDFAVRISRFISNVPDLSMWIDKWFKTTITQKALHFPDLDAEPSPRNQIREPFPAYLNIVSWDGNDVLQANVYTKDEAGNWDPAAPLLMYLYFFAGSQLNFVCSSEVDTGNSKFGFTMLFKGMRNRAGNFVRGNMTTLGARFLGVDDASNSTERWAGSVEFRGSMIDESKVPPTLLIGP